MDLLNIRVHLAYVHVLEIRIYYMDVQIRRGVADAGDGFVEISHVAANQGSFEYRMLLALAARFCLCRSFVEAQSVNICMEARRLRGQLKQLRLVH